MSDDDLPADSYQEAAWWAEHQPSSLPTPSEGHDLRTPAAVAQAMLSSAWAAILLRTFTAWADARRWQA